MRQKKWMAVTIMAIGVSMTACNSIPMFNSGGEEFVHNDISFGYDKNPDFKSGVVDGCKTSSGKYTKNHTSFKTNESYRMGWGSGRLQCKSEQ